jgi:hypothetical protein
MPKVRMAATVAVMGMGLFSTFENEARATGGGPFTVECFSQSIAHAEFDYYDCGDCKKKDGRRAYGNAFTCQTSPD